MTREEQLEVALRNLLNALKDVSMRFSANSPIMSRYISAKVDAEMLLEDDDVDETVDPKDVPAIVCNIITQSVEMPVSFKKDSAKRLGRDLQIDELGRVEVLIDVESLFGIEIKDDEILDDPSVEEIVKLVDKKIKAKEA